MTALHPSRGFVAAVVVVVALAGCGGAKSTTGRDSGSTTSNHVSTSTVSPRVVVRSELISVSDMPTGWSIDPSANSGSDGGLPACLQGAQDPAGALATAQVSFKGSAAGTPSAGEALYFMKPGRAGPSLAVVERALNGCGAITLNAGGQTLKGSLGAMSFPTVGTESRAYQLSLTGSAHGVSVTVGFDLVVARKANTVMFLFLADFGSPDTAFLQHLATTAASKVGGSLT